jgi:di/tripeptidase
MIGHRPAGQLPTDHPLVRMACQCLEELDIQPTLSIGSTDANVPFSRGLPAVCLGLTHGGGAHTRSEYIQTAPVAQGLEQLLLLVPRAFSLKPGGA